jgi:ComF family protein
MLDWLADFVAPVRCAACETHGDVICGDCSRVFAASIPVTRAARDGTPPVIALGPYTGRLARAIRTIKFCGRSGAALRLGALLASRLALPIEVIVAVPLHASRLRERGFNQAALLANAIAESLSLPHLPDALRRPISTRAQSKLSVGHRRENVKSAFAPGPQASLVSGRRVLLVDDVVTTGATLASCADAIRACDARDIVACALALRL